MELALIILTVGIVFWINQPLVGVEKLKQIAKSIDEELSKEFKKIDERIKELEVKINRIENTVVEKETKE